MAAEQLPHRHIAVIRFNGVDGGSHDAVKGTDIKGVPVAPVQDPLDQLNLILHKFILKSNGPDAFPVLRRLYGAHVGNQMFIHDFLDIRIYLPEKLQVFFHRCLPKGCLPGKMSGKVTGNPVSFLHDISPYQMVINSIVIIKSAGTMSLFT